MKNDKLIEQVGFSYFNPIYHLIGFYIHDLKKIIWIVAIAKSGASRSRSGSEADRSFLWQPITVWFILFNY